MITPIIPFTKYTFTSGDKVNFYFRENGKKQWEGFDLNPYMMCMIKVNKKNHLLFAAHVREKLTGGNFLHRFCEQAEIVGSSITEKDLSSGLWYTRHTIMFPSSAVDDRELGFRVIPAIPPTVKEKL